MSKYHINRAASLFAALSLIHQTGSSKTKFKELFDSIADVYLKELKKSDLAPTQQRLYEHCTAYFTDESIFSASLNACINQLDADQRETLATIVGKLSNIGDGGKTLDAKLSPFVNKLTS